MIKLLSLYSGANGMVLGQILDMEGERGDLTAAQLERIHENKTGRLLTIPFLAAAVLCEREADLPIWEEIGKRLGLSFQIQDDILDVTSSSAVLGKNINSDEENHKTTYVKRWPQLIMRKRRTCFIRWRSIQNRCYKYLRHLPTAASK